MSHLIGGGAPSPLAPSSSVARPTRPCTQGVVGTTRLPCLGTAVTSGTSGACTSPPPAPCTQGDVGTTRLQWYSRRIRQRLYLLAKEEGWQAKYNIQIGFPHDLPKVGPGWMGSNQLTDQPNNTFHPTPLYLKTRPTLVPEPGN